MDVDAYVVPDSIKTNKLFKKFTKPPTRDNTGFLLVFVFFLKNDKNIIIWVVDGAIIVCMAFKVLVQGANFVILEKIITDFFLFFFLKIHDFF